jgi:Trehalose-phosphatase
VHRAQEASQKKAAPSRSVGRISPVFNSWREISGRVRASKNIALFLDFDGTLVDFCSRPEQVKLSARTEAALRKLASHGSVRVTIVSGRRNASLLQFIKTPRAFSLRRKAPASPCIFETRLRKPSATPASSFESSSNACART